MAVHERTEPLSEPPRVGIVGAGQLARMLCEAASELGVQTVVLAADPADAAVATAGSFQLGRPTDPGALRALATRCDVLTLDHELVDRATLAELEATGSVVAPAAEALACAADKSVQRRRFAAAGIPVPEFVVLGPGDAGDTPADVLSRFADRLGAVPVVKAATGGYDGRGVVVTTALDQAIAATTEWLGSGVAVVAEAPVAFRTELAALLARRPDGGLAAWRTVRTAQVGGVCREVRVPGGLDDELDERARALAARVAEVVGVVGVLAVELFDVDGALVVNEVATRPHNSGHWTIEGSTTSQFENHLRAILSLPLGDTSTVAGAVCTVNVFGADGSPPRLHDALSVPGAHVHRYGKAPRPGRKLGHVTVVGDDDDDVARRAWEAAVALGTPRLELAAPR